MKFAVKFEELEQTLVAEFGEVQNVSDGGFERGYKAGYEKGEADGLRKGYDEGLAARSYEIWTITLADGSIVEKEVPLL